MTGKSSLGEGTRLQIPLIPDEGTRAGRRKTPGQRGMARSALRRWKSNPHTLLQLAVDMLVRLRPLPAIRRCDGCAAPTLQARDYGCCVWLSCCRTVAAEGRVPLPAILAKALCNGQRLDAAPEQHRCAATERKRPAYRARGCVDRLTTSRFTRPRALCFLHCFLLLLLQARKDVLPCNRQFHSSPPRAAR
mgnify:CR=1 FL=1